MSTSSSNSSNSSYRTYTVSAKDEEMMDRISDLRLRVWTEEGTLVASALKAEKKGAWIEKEDSVATHWVVEDEQKRLVGAARMIMHNDLILDGSADTVLWVGRGLPLPTATFSRTVVLKEHRGKGLGMVLNKAMFDAAREAGAASIIVSASEANARILLRLGFRKTDIVVRFPDRPTVDFFGYEIIFPKASL